MFNAVYMPVDVYGKRMHVPWGGAVLAGVEVIDYIDNSLLRSKLISLRNADDSLGFDSQVISGNRIRLFYSSEDAAIPVSNNAVLTAAYKKILRRTFTVASEAMRISNIEALRSSFITCQLYWNNRAKLEQQLSEQDITVTEFLRLSGEYAQLVDSPPYGDINTPLYSGPAMFAEGASFSVGAYCIDWATDIKLSFVHEEIVSC